jgi:penicillin-binding protein 1A
MKKIFKFLTYLLSLSLLLGILGSVGIIGMFYYFGAGLPDYQQLKVYEPPVVTRLYANDGRLFGEYASEKRVFVPINAIPAHVKQAFISAEDKNFYTHPGIDFFGITRAVLMNVKKILGRKRLVGASTITQQVARNFLLTETSTLVSFERKFKEAILSFRIEHAYTKDHILELYLNEIYLGNRSYGVAAAAMNYFNKSLDELSIAEVAYLAALPKAPSRYHPEKNRKQAIERRNWVIERMFEDGYIKAADVTVAKAELLTIHEQKEQNIVRADFFAEEVRRTLLAKYGEKGLYESGLAVRTTLEPALQELADKALKAGLENYDCRHGWRGPLITLKLEEKHLTDKGWIEELKRILSPAGNHNWEVVLVLKIDGKQATLGFKDGKLGYLPLENLKWARKWISSDNRGEVITKPSQVLSVGDVILVEQDQDEKGKKLKYFHLRQIPKVSGAIVVMDPHTGRVLALGGGYSFEISQFNRATQAMRQLGSTIKSFIYLSALEHGMTPSSIIEDAPITINLGGNLGVYSPRNYNRRFMGPLSLRRALELSRNAVTVRLVHDIIGTKSVAEICQRFGLYDHLPLQFSMALGAGETTLLKATNAYAMLVNGGRKITPTLIDRVQNRHGQTVQTGNTRKCIGCETDVWQEQEPPELIDDRETIADPVNMYQIVSILEGSVQRGTSRRAKVIPQPVAGKTGTSNDFRDAYYIGFSPDLVVGIFIGFDDFSSLGEDESGARVASPIFVDFMKEALKNSPSTPFRIPPGTNLVRVNPFTGKRATEGEKNVILEAFKAESSPEDNTIYSPTSRKGSSIGSGGLY